MEATTAQGQNQRAFGMMMAQVKRFGWTVKRFQEELEQHSLFYSRDGINNWGKRGRAFPKNPELISAIITILTSDPKRRWTAAHCIDFALAAGQPVEFLGQLATQPFVPTAEYQAALSQHLTARFGAAAQPVGDGADLLLKMPLDAVPTPIGSARGLFPRNPFLSGRDQDVLQLARWVRDERRSRIVITGVSGQGKTQLAGEFARCYGSYFAGGVLLATADTPARLRADVLAWGGESGLALHPGYGTLPEPEQRRLLQRALADPLPRLLIIDNASSGEAYLLEDLVPDGGCVVVATSQHLDWGPQWSIFELPPLTPAASVQLFRRICPRLTAADEPMIHQIAHRVDYLPFALSLASAFLRRHRQGPLGSLHHFYQTLCSREIIDHDALRAADEPRGPADVQRSVAAAMGLMLAALEDGDRVDRQARDILICAAACAPGAPLPIEWLLAGTLGQSCAQPLPKLLFTALQRLRDLGLLTAGPEHTVALHRLLRSYVRTQHDLRPTLARLAQTACAEMSRYETSLTQVHLIAQHVREVAEHALAAGLPDAANITMGIGWYASLNGQHQEAIRWLEAAHASALANYGQLHSVTGEVYCRLGLACLGLTQYERGARYLHTMVEIFEQIYAPAHPERALGYHNYGTALILCGVYADGEQMIRRSLAIRRAQLRAAPGDDALRRDIARNLRALGQLSWYVGRYRRAYWYTWLAWRIFASDAGAAPIALAQTCHNLGAILFLRGRYAEAQAWLGQALSQRLELYRSRCDSDGRCWHQDIAETLSLQGWVLLALGQHDAAEPVLREALAINEQVLGHQSYETIQSLEPVAELAVARRQDDVAGELADRIERALADIFGPDAVLAQARAHERRARLAWLQGDLTSARDRASQAVAICRRICPDHPHPIAGWAAAVLSQIADAQGDAAGAAAWAAQARAILELTVPTHPAAVRVVGALDRRVHRSGR